MSLRLPGQSSGRRLQTGVDTLDYEIAGEMASSLGRAGDRVRQTLAALARCEVDGGDRAACLSAASAAVYAYFIQRELVGLRRHQDAIRDYGIPAEVLARLGAS